MSLSRLELEHTLTVVQKYRDSVALTKMELEERARAGHNGPIQQAMTACENELYLLRGIIAKLIVLLRNYPPRP